MASQNGTTTNTQTTTSNGYTANSTFPIFEVIKGNLPTIIALCAIVGLFYVLFYRVDVMEKVQADQEEQLSTSEQNQQEILTRLAVIESKQDRDSSDIKEILQAVKGPQ